MKIAVLGAGAWGTAIAVSAADRHEVTLWARDARQAQLLDSTRSNARYLPGSSLPASLRIATNAAIAAAEGADLVVIATPMAALREQLTALHTLTVPVVWLCKGIEASSDAVDSQALLGHEICMQVAPRLLAGVLSGPSFAKEVAHGCPTAMVASSTHPRVRDALVAAFHSPSLRIYANDDIVGVEVGGAVKNVLAIATGLCDGLALITRGLAEMTRFGLALGARSDTFMGLSGLGDLVLTATGDLSRNRQVGLLLAQGQTLAQAVDSLGHVAEGVYCARAVVRRAGQMGVDMPIAQCVVALLDGRLRPEQAVTELMGRDPVTELSALSRIS